jgi:hypothetical protein
MSITNPIGTSRSHITRSTSGPVLALTGALAASLVFAAAMQPWAARETLMPATVTLIFGLAAAISLFAWLRPKPARQFTYWDAAGVLTFIGICAAAAVEPEQMMQLVAGSERAR